MFWYAYDSSKLVLRSASCGLCALYILTFNIFRINTTLPGLLFSDQYLSLSMALSSTYILLLGVKARVPLGQIKISFSA